jgi:hypothetical protein
MYESRTMRLHRERKERQQKARQQRERQQAHQVLSALNRGEWQPWFGQVAVRELDRLGVSPDRWSNLGRREYRGNPSLKKLAALGFAATVTTR